MEALNRIKKHLSTTVKVKKNFFRALFFQLKTERLADFPEPKPFHVLLLELNTDRLFVKKPRPATEKTSFSKNLLHCRDALQPGRGDRHALRNPGSKTGGGRLIPRIQTQLAAQFPDFRLAQAAGSHRAAHAKFGNGPQTRPSGLALLQIIGIAAVQKHGNAFLSQDSLKKLIHAVFAQIAAFRRIADKFRLLQQLHLNKAQQGGWKAMPVRPCCGPLLFFLCLQTGTGMEGQHVFCAQRVNGGPKQKGGVGSAGKSDADPPEIPQQAAKTGSLLPTVTPAALACQRKNPL